MFASVFDWSEGAVGLIGEDRLSQIDIGEPKKPFCQYWPRSPVPGESGCTWAGVLAGRCDELAVSGKPRTGCVSDTLPWLGNVPGTTASEKATASRKNSRENKQMSRHNG